MAKAFDLLHPGVQRRLWDMKWTELRPIQTEAIQLLCGGTPTDCIISSPTASGKTEAAFLPVLSMIADDAEGGVRAMYIGPLKALINDQFGRLEQLCTRMEMPVHRWHGDIDETARKALLKSPSGILLITPESLEAMFVLRPAQLPSIFSRLSFVVIDEMHAFLGSVRGAQLLSQLHRLRMRTGADAIRIGLSATLGAPEDAKRWLRPDGRPVRLIQATSGGAELGLKVRGFWRKAPEESEDKGHEEPDAALVDVARSLLLACKGNTNLVFANSKSLIEQLADELITQAKDLGVNDEIVVHHGSLSKDSREHAEATLRADRPCTAVCSNTLEMGIDIGSIDEVVQVSAPWSVASLVQRLGRSGRREGSKRILRGFFIEDRGGPSAGQWDELHLDFVRGIAIIELMLEKFLESPQAERRQLSTLVQQVLSCAAETGGIRANDLYDRTVGSGAFVGVDKKAFVALLRGMAERDLIEQLEDTTLVLGLKGQRIVEHYSFYAAFRSTTEFTVLHGNRQIGTLPETYLPPPGEHFVLAGRRWRVEEIDVDRREVVVTPSRGRRPPLFSSGASEMDPRVHQMMRQLLLGTKEPGYLDEIALEILRVARTTAKQMQIERDIDVAQTGTWLRIWHGSRIHRTLYLVLAAAGLRLQAEQGIGLFIEGSTANWQVALRAFIEKPDATSLALLAEKRLKAKSLDGEKYDNFVPLTIWAESYGRERLDVHGAVRVAEALLAAGSAGSTPAAPSFEGEVIAIDGPTDWARAIAAIPVDGPLPTRTVLVPSERHAHALRVVLARSAPGTLVGTRFMTTGTAAQAVLENAGVQVRPGEEAHRPLRLRHVFRNLERLAAHDMVQLRGVPGWATAFARAVLALEDAGLRPEDLASVAVPEAADVAAIWRSADTLAGPSWSRARIIDEARRVLASDPRAWPFDGHTLGMASATSSRGEAMFLRAIPGLLLGVHAARPHRTPAIQRVRALFGDAAAESIQAIGKSEADTELAILKGWLFADPEALRKGGRPRSLGSDATVSLEANASVAEELDATERWVAERIMAGVPLADIAVLAPSVARATLVASRLRERVPVHTPSTASLPPPASGQLLIAVLRAVEEGLPSQRMVELIPRLLPEGDGLRLSPGRARELMRRLGTVGGGSAKPEGALTWLDSFRRLAEAEPNGDDVRTQNLAPLVPAIEALVAVSTAALHDAPIADVWQAIRDFASSWLAAPTPLAPALDAVDASIQGFVAELRDGSPRGFEAVRVVRETIGIAPQDQPRFGEPAVFVGLLEHACGLPFTAMRIVGLEEGAFPAGHEDDVVLSRPLRAHLPPHSLVSAEERAAGGLHALHRVIRGTASVLCVSSARTDHHGSERQPSSTFVEIAAALGRPGTGTIPSLHEIDAQYFRPTRAESTERRVHQSWTSLCWLRRTALGAADLPSAWLASPLFAPRELLGCKGRFDAPHVDCSAAEIPGVSETRPISASAAASLLACPHRFLLERVLGFRPVLEPRGQHRIDADAYGTLFHRVAEQFATAHGEEFGARRHNLDHWLVVGRELSDREFETFLLAYPLFGPGVAASEQQRLRGDVQTLVQHEWDAGGVWRLVGAEVEFGMAAPLTLTTDEGPLFVHGRIDRIDDNGTVVRVRDLKTGRAHPRERDEADPTVGVDLQLAVYLEATRAIFPERAAGREVVGSYLYVDRLALEKERAFHADAGSLRAAGSRWLSLAAGLLRRNLFVRSPDSEDCKRCPFDPVCGRGAAARSAEALDGSDGLLGQYRDLKA